MISFLMIAFYWNQVVIKIYILVNKLLMIKINFEKSLFFNKN